MAKAQRKIIDKVFILLGLAAVAVLIAVGCLAWWGYDYATSSVRDELISQKIYFPAAGSPALTSLPPANQAAMEKYAGQQLVNGAQAKVYANDFIAYHLSKIAGGQTYSQISAAAKANPKDAALQQQAATLFQGETLRGLLLGDGYAYWEFGVLAKYVAIATFIGAGVMVVLVWLGLRHLAKN